MNSSINSQLLSQKPGLVPVNYDFERQRIIWKDLGDCPFDKPFFSWSIQAWEELHGPATAIETDIAPFFDEGLVPDATSPTAFVFHCSRCGSTLLARILAQDPSAILLSEPDPINALLFPFCLRPTPGEPLPAAVRTLLRNLVFALGRHRGLGHERSYIKFTSWNVLLIDVIREVFPEVPTLFVYRDPGAVLVSLQHEPAGFTDPGDDPYSRFISGRPEPLPAISEPLEHTTAVLQRMFEMAVADPTLSTLDHRDLRPENLPHILRHFGITPGDSVRDAMLAEFNFYAKNYGSEIACADDTAGKVRALTPELSVAAGKLSSCATKLSDQSRNLIPSNIS